MERALKERIIGAVILVIVAILIVPVFLDGPPQDGEIVKERVLLPGQGDQETKTVVLDRERNQPIPVASANETEAVEVDEVAEPDVEPVVEVATATAEETPVEVETSEENPAETASEVAQPAAVESPSTTGMWAVQLGSFSSKENAENLAASLRKQGYAAFLSQLQASSGPLHRVRIGPQKDRESAEEMAERLQRVGHKGQVVPHP